MFPPRPHTTVLLLLLTGCVYEAPLDPGFEPLDNVISGSLISESLPLTARTLVFLTDVNNPPPPAGTGRPETFAVIPATEFQPSSPGLFSAPFTLTGVPDGTWLVTALMDFDEDFHPGVPTLAGSTCGDLAGAYVTDLSATALAPVTVEGGSHASGVTAALASAVPIERPAFTIDDALSTVDPTRPFQLESVALQASFGPLSLDLRGPFNPGLPDPCDTAFWVHLRDVDGDGTIDPHPSYDPMLGVPDVWPRVFLQWMGEPIDADDDGIPERFERGGQDPGTTWSAEGLPFAPTMAALAAQDPQELLALIGTTFPTTSLDVAVSGAYLRTDADGTQEVVTDPTAVPTGAWSVTVMAESGQTWTVPNELEPRVPSGVLVPPPGLTSDPVPSQGAWLEREGP